MTVEFSESFERKLDSEKLLDAVNNSAKQLTYDLYNQCQEDSPYDTGKLQESHSWRGEGTKENIHAMVEVGAEYWTYLEFGTSKMDARHWIANAVTKVDPYATFQDCMRTFLM